MVIAQHSPYTKMRRSWLLLTLGCFWAVSDSAVADRATDEEMARAALQSEIRTTDSEVAEVVINEARMMLINRASHQQEEMVAATVVFGRGQSAADLERFAVQHGLEYAGVEFKFPVGDQGRVVTAFVGARDLLLLEGTISERLKKAAGALQYQLLRMAGAEEGAPAERMREAAEARDPLAYKVDVVGAVGAISLLLDNPGVLAVFLDEEGSKLESFQTQQSWTRNARRGFPGPITRRLEDGPPPGVTPDQILRAP